MQLLPTLLMRMAAEGIAYPAGFPCPDPAEMFADAQAFVVDDAAKMLRERWKDPKQQDADFASTPNAAPPFPRFWMEYGFPCGNRYGAIFDAKTRAAGGWTVTSHYFEGIAGARPRLLAVKRVAEIDAAGHVEGGIVKEWGMTGNGPDRMAAAATDSILAFATNLLHCRNASTEETPVPEDQQRRLARKLGHRAGGFIYRTLIIRDASGRVVHRGLTSPSDGTAFHATRGHFKTYSVERPLFGRFSGTYYWTGRTKGKKEKGTIEKTYVLSPTTSNAEQN